MNRKWFNLQNIYTIVQLFSTIAMIFLTFTLIMTTRSYMLDNRRLVEATLSEKTPYVEVQFDSVKGAAQETPFLKIRNLRQSPAFIGNVLLSFSFYYDWGRVNPNALRGPEPPADPPEDPAVREVFKQSKLDFDELNLAPLEEKQLFLKVLGDSYGKLYDQLLAMENDHRCEKMPGEYSRLKCYVISAEVELWVFKYFPDTPTAQVKYGFSFEGQDKDVSRLERKAFFPPFLYNH